MPHPHGTYLGGIRTVEDLRQRCYVDPCTDCWRWKLGTSQGSPRVHFRLPDGIYRTERGRRAALMLARQGELKPTEYAVPRMSCASPSCCVNPAHAFAGTRLQHATWAKAQGVHATPAKRVANAREAAKRRTTTPEQERAILEAQGSRVVLAARFGVGVNVVARVQRQGRPDLMRGASVFSLGAL